MPKGEDKAQVQCSFAAPVMVPQGDGSFMLKPGKPILGRSRLAVSAAARRAGVSESTIRRLLDAGLVEGEQPSPRKLFVYCDSLDAHLQNSRDREYWEGKNRVNYLQEIERGG